MEPNEIQEFTEEVEQGAETSMRDVSLIISILAVLVAIVMVMGHREHTKAVLMQARATDQWNEYQAHKDRLEQVSIASDALSLEPYNASYAAQAKLAQYRASTAKWTRERDEDQHKAIDFQDDVEAAEKRASRFDLGEALLQIAIVLASITLLTRHRRYAYVATAIGLAGMAIAAAGFLVHHG
jgi:hypothetical protein